MTLLQGDKRLNEEARKEIGFGVNTKTEPDALGGKRSDGGIAHAGESKHVSGGFRRIHANIGFCLDQLCVNERCRAYAGKVVGRVVIDPGSDAYRELQKRRGKSNSKPMDSAKSAWDKVRHKYYEEGKNNWKRADDVGLRLIVLWGGVVVYDYCYGNWDGGKRKRKDTNGEGKKKRRGN